MKKQAKVTIVGAGNVGGTTAQKVVEKNLAEVVLVEVNTAEGLAKGKALDLSQASSVEGHSRKIIGTSDYSLTKDSEIVVITAGVARKPGMSRNDLLKTNAQIVSSVAQNAVKYSPEAIFIVVSNPLDVMTYLTQKVTGLPKERVIGMAGVLDSSRMRFFIAEALNLSPEDVVAFVLGGHGDSMVPLARYSSVSGVPLTQLLSSKKIEEINTRTRNGGAEIVKLLETGSAFYAPASSVFEMISAVLTNSNKILPACASIKQGQFGIKNSIYLGVPIVLNQEGVRKIIEIDLTNEEQKSLANSAEDVRKNIEVLETLVSLSKV